MPYIKESERVQLLRALSHLHPQDKGELNYVICKLLEGYVETHDLNYQNLSDAVAGARDAAAEFERRIVGPYEDRKIAENGDVFDADFLRRIHG